MASCALTVEPCSDPECGPCTTTARGFPQPVWKDYEEQAPRATRASRDGFFDPIAARQAKGRTKTSNRKAWNDTRG